MSEGAVETEQPAAPPAIQLKAARTAAGLAVADVARHLMLSPWQIEALESGDYARLPGPVFARGFIRNYAPLLKIDASPLLAGIAQQAPAAAPAVPESAQTDGIPFPRRRGSNWRPYALGALVIVAMLVAYEFYGDDLAPEAGDTRSVVIELPEPKIVAAAKPVDQAPLENAPAPAAAQTVQPAKEPVAPVAPRADSRPVPVAPGANERVVRLMFSRDSWVEVRDRQGRIIFSQLNLAGTTQAVNGQPPLRLVVGNAGGVRLMFNDRPVDLAPFTQVDVARLTLE